jgi:hypothetical protein
MEEDVDSDAQADSEELDEAHLTRLHGRFVAMVKAMRLPQVRNANGNSNPGLINIKRLAA